MGEGLLERPVLNGLGDLSHLSLDEKRRLLQALLRRQTAAAPPPEPTFPLSAGQASLWFVYQLAPASPAYNFAYAAEVRQPLDLPAFRRAYQKLAQRHPALRTTFENSPAGPVQRVHDHLDVELAVLDAPGRDHDNLLRAIRAEADRPFDLRNGPVVRMALYRLAPGQHVLSILVHHVVADLWSMDLLVRELRQLYGAEHGGFRAEMPPVRASYADFVRWQAAQAEGPRGRKAWDYWQARLAGPLPVLALPTDR
ncbi:MAG TPA: condensation domain-containing protein, partial [Gemmataceae bacterium]|nr:condensation domain-containing protein [Gemmataceae bacterium]